MTRELIVFVRIALYMLAGYLVQGGWLPEHYASLLTNPETVEAVAGGVVAVGALVWYLISEARGALRDRGRWDNVL